MPKAHGGTLPFKNWDFFFLPEQATLAVPENPSYAKPDLSKTWFEVWFPLEGGVHRYFSGGEVGCALCCNGWQPAANVISVGKGNHSCPNPRH